MKKFIAGLVLLSLFAQPAVSQQKTNDIVIRVNAEKQKTINVLKSGGIKAAELKDLGPVLSLLNFSGDEDPILDGAAHFIVSYDATKLPANIQGLQFNYLVLDNGEPRTDITVWPDTTQLFFAVGCKPRTIGIVVEIGYGLTKDDKTVQQVMLPPIYRKLIVGEPAPPEPVTPPIPIPVVPTFDDGKYKLSALSYQMAVENVPAASRNLAAPLASALQTLSFKITGSPDGVVKPDPSIKDIEGAQTAMRVAIASVLGESSADWVQWKKLVGDKIYALYTAKQLNTPADVATACLEIAKGLSKVN